MGHSADSEKKIATQTPAPTTEQAAEETAFVRLGGAEGVRRIVTDFIQRVYRDPIIGFFFQQIDQAALIEREFEFASMHLGGPSAYKGRPLAVAHQIHPINRGHFHRRLWILEQVLQAHEAPADIIQHWLVHNKKLEFLVTDGSDCVPESNGEAK